MGKDPHIFIRVATEADAAAIIRCHYDAVHVTCASDYDAEILDDWSGQESDRISRMESYILANREKENFLVAELAGSVVGFAEIVAANEELRAVYVAPSAGGKGVGKALLCALEQLAREQHLTRLWLDASLTAEKFYMAQGYIKESEGEHILRTGRKMKCSKMYKSFS